VRARSSEAGALFTTARLAVRPYAQADRAAHLRLRADREVCRFMHWPEHEGFDCVLADAAGRTPPDRKGWINLAVIDRETGALAGDHGLKTERGLACIGLAVMPERRREGLGRELVYGSMAWLHRHGFRRVRAEIDFGNEASFALFRSLGFVVVADRQDQFGPFSVLERATV
jgi:RimJ/RimL family protein N-acetyltransferase